jgi:hypothetical protein
MHLDEWIPVTKVNIVTAHKNIHDPACHNNPKSYDDFNNSFFLYIQHLVFDYKTLSRIRIELAKDMVHWLNFQVTVVNC